MDNVFIEDNYKSDNDKFLSDKIGYDNIYFDSGAEDFFLEAYPSASFDEYFKRMWEFYLSYCEGGFKSRNINLIQFSMSNRYSS